jgi:hypothetical protein
VAQKQFTMTTEYKNYGLIIKQKDPTGYVLGSGQMPYEILQADGDWQNYLPEKEIQFTNGVEPFACVSYTILNCVEMLIKRKYGITRNYSDRFLAAISGTNNFRGNDPHAVCEFLRKIGVVPEEMYPFDATSFDDYYKPIPQALVDLANDFNKEWDFKHEYVPEVHEEITKALKSSPLLVAVPAWFRNAEGLYYRPGTMPDNHATTLIYERIGAFRRVFDSYENPHLKDIEWNTVPMVIKRFHIEKKEQVIHTTPLPSLPLWVKILEWFRSKWLLFKYFYKQNEQA